MKTDQLLLALTLSVLIALIWSSWIVMSARGLGQGMTPFDLTLLRFAAPALVSLPWLFTSGAWRDGRKLFFVGVCIGAPHALLLQFGLAQAGTTHAAVLLTGMIPVFGMLFGWMLFRQRPRAAAGVGLAMILGGIVLIMFNDAAALGAFAPVWPGDAYFVAAAALWAALTMGITRFRMAPMETVAVVSVMSTLVYVPIYLLWLPTSIAAAPLMDIGIQALFQGLLSILVAVSLYAVVVRMAGPQRAATIPAAVPVLTLALAFLVLDQPPTWLEVAGAVVVALGIWAVVRRGPVSA